MIKKAYYLMRKYTGINLITYSVMGNRLFPFILCYHRVNYDSFLAQVRELKKLFAIVDLNTFILNLNKSQPKHYVVITVDDCAREAVENSYKVASKEKIPITYYIPTKHSSEQKPLWHNRIAKIIEDNNKLSFQGKEFSVNTLKRKKLTRNRIITHFCQLKLKTERIDKMITGWIKKNKIYENTNIQEKIKVTDKKLLKKIKSNKKISIQSHSVSHSFFCSLSEGEIRKELSDSKDFIESITGKKVFSFCHPYGSKQDIGQKVLKIIPDYYDNAVTFIQGVCDNKSNHFFLPRIGIYPDENLNAFFGKIFHYQNKKLIENLLSV